MASLLVVLVEVFRGLVLGLFSWLSLALKSSIGNLVITARLSSLMMMMMMIDDGDDGVGDDGDDGDDGDEVTCR